MSDKKAPRNTTADDPIVHLAGAMADGDDFIPNQEAQGQRGLVNSDTLPTDMGHGGSESKEILEAAGVKFLDEVEGDPMFQYVELPEGWEKRATDHSMWSHLVDDKGRKRASIFYKAAFYDRSAHMSLERRYQTRRDYDRQDKEGVTIAEVLDGDTVIHTTEPIKLPEDRDKQYAEARKADEAAHAWLDENFPEWQSPSAYWD